MEAEGSGALARPIADPSRAGGAHADGRKQRMEP